MPDLESFKNRYSDQRVFIIGNGPSLTKTPLDRMAGEYSIAMNRISLLYNKTKWRPTFFICTTSNIRKKEWRRDIMQTINQNILTFAWSKLRSYIGERKNVFYLDCYHGKEETNSAPLEWWYDDISKGVCKFGTSMLVALQLAFYMDFKTVYIVGADLGFVESPVQKIFKRLHLHLLSEFMDRNHFAPSYGTPGLGAEALNRNMLAAHELAKTVAEKKQISVFNATVGGYLEVYPRVNLYDVLK